jgi:hypothetical protein
MPSMRTLFEADGGFAQHIVSVRLLRSDRPYGIHMAVFDRSLLPGSLDAGAVAGGRHDGMTAVAGIVAAQDPGRTSCSERRRPSTLTLEAEAALRISVHRSANRLFSTGGAEVRAAFALDIPKNLLRCRLEKCR